MRRPHPSNYIKLLRQQQRFNETVLPTAALNDSTYYRRTMRLVMRSKPKHYKKCSAQTHNKLKLLSMKTQTLQPIPYKNHGNALRTHHKLKFVLPRNITNSSKPQQRHKPYNPHTIQTS